MASSSEAADAGADAPAAAGSGARGLIAPAARLAGKGLGTALAAKEHVVTKTQLVANVAVGAASEVADKVEERMSEEQKQKASAAAGKAKSLGAVAAASAMEVGMVVAASAKEGYDQTQEQVASVKQAAFDALSDEDKQLLLEARRRYDVKREALKEQVLDFSSPYAWKLVGLLKDQIVAVATADPYMWRSAKRAARWALDNVFDDVGIEAKNALKSIALKTDEDSLPPIERCCLHPANLRAFILHHLYPHDRSIFGKLWDPWFYILTFPSLIPVFCIREVFFVFVLLMLVFPGPPDEFQLCSFILQFKSKQFITGGFLSSMVIMLRAFLCKWGGGWGGSLCVDPEGVIFGAAQLVISVLLVWIAFFLLPCSKQYGVPRFLSQDDTASGCAKLIRLEESRPRTACCGLVSVSEDRGGRLAGLLKWDLLCFVLSCLVCGGLFTAAYVSKISTADPIAGATLTEMVAEALLFARCFYSFLSFPFFIFDIPGLSRLLMHTQTTGFDEYGRCVPFRMAVVRKGGAVRPEEP